MNLELLEALFFWCMIINLGIYIATAIAVFAFKGLLCKFHKMMFGFDEATTMETVNRYMGNYKLLITIFNFTPWLAILIIQ